MIVGVHERRAVYKRYNVVDNGPDSVLETSGAIMLISKYNRFSMDVMNHNLFPHTGLIIKHIYLSGTWNNMMT